MKKNLFFGTLLFLASIFIFESCEVGLGESVDTEPPKVTISTPTAGYVIRDKFTMEGTCSDEQGVKSVEIQFIHTSDDSDVKTYYPSKTTYYVANLNSTATKWDCTIDPTAVTSKIPDGNYEAYVLVKDRSGRSSFQTKSFAIDNTAPLIVLTRPSEKYVDKNSATDSYGQEFTIEGQAADNNNIDSIEIAVYDVEKPTELIKTITLNNVPLSINLTAAEFGSKDNNVYEEIYGTDKNAGTKKYFCKITAYDSARKLPAQTGDKGNATEGYYIYNDIYSSVLKNFKINEVENMISGTYSGSATTETISSVLSALKTTSIQSSSFSLNPLNNPTFTLQGYSALKLNGNDFSNVDNQISNGSKVTVKVSSGLDNIPLNDDTLGVEAYECDAAGAITGQKIVIVPVYKDKHGNVLITDANEISNRAALITSVGSYARTLTIALAKSDNGLKIGHNYILQAVGCDENGNEINNNGETYGFMLTSGGAAPTLSITSPTDSILYLKKDASIHVVGTTSHDEGAPTVTINIGEKTITKSNVTSFDENIITSDFVPSADIDTSNQYTLSVKSTYSGVNSSPKEKTVMYDVDNPIINISQVTPIVERNSKSYNVNGIVTVKGTITDEFTSVDTSSLKYEVYDNNSKVDELCGNIDKPSPFTVSVDTTKLTDKTNLDLRIIARDKAENEVVYNVMFDSSSSDIVGTQSYYIDQSTDSPIVSTISADSALTANEIAAGKNLFNTTTNNKIIFSVEDDDGLASPIIINCYKLNADLTVGEEVNTSQSEKVITEGTASASVTYILPATEGKYKVIVTTKDIGYATASAESKQYHQNEAKSFFVGVDSGAPSIILKSTSGAFRAASTAFDVEGTVYDSCGKVTLYRYSTKAEAQKKEQNDPSATNGDITPTEITIENNTDTPWSENFSAAMVGSEGKTVYYVVEDIYKQSTLIAFTYKVDALAPTIAPNWDAEKTEDWTNSSAYNYKIPISDAWDNVNNKKIEDDTGVALYSGISSVSVKIDDLAPSTMTLGDAYDGASGLDYDGLYYYYTSTVSFNEGKHTVKIEAKDIAGNTTADPLVTYAHKIDKTAPTLQLGAYDSSITGVKFASLNDDYKIPVTITDSLSGVGNIRILDGINDITNKVEKSNNNNNYSFKFKNETLTTGSHSFVFEVSDNAGNIATTSASVFVDKVGPTIEVNGVSPTVTSGGTKVNGKIKITGTVLDETKLGTTGAVKLEVLLGDEVKQTLSANFAENQTYASWTFEIDTKTLDDKKTYTLQITAKDAVDNETKNTDTTINVDQDTDKPTVTFSNMAATGTVFGMGSNTIYGNAIDDDGISKIVYIIDPSNPNPPEEIGNINSTTKQFTIDISSCESGEHTLEVVVYDINNPSVKNEDTNQTYTFIYDNQAPEITVTTVGGKVPTSGMWAASNFDVVGTATDDSGIKGVYLKDTETDETKNLVTSGKTTKSAAWTDHVTGETDTTEKKSRTYIVVDINGRKSEATISYQVDTILPVFNSANIKIKGSSQGSTITCDWSDVSNHWFNNTAIKIEGKGDSEDSLKALKEIHPASLVMTYDGSPNTINIGTNNAFSSTITFNEGSSVLNIDATDEAGNKATQLTLNINVDTTIPVVSAVTLSGTTEKDSTKYANGSSTLSLAVTTTDPVNNGAAASGISKVLVGLVPGFTETNAIATASSGFDSISIDKSKLSEGNVTLYVKSIDKAGNNSTEYSTGLSFIYDRTDPAVTITSPTALSTVNKTITIAGTVQDNNISSTTEPVLWIKNAGVWKTANEYASGTTSNPTLSSINWSIDVDTTKFTDQTTHILQVRFTDNAGNITAESETYSLKVDQDSDRPRIKLQNLTLGTSMSASSRVWHKDTEIRGTVTDEDGVNGIYIAIADSIPASDSASWGSNLYDGGSWSYALSGLDGDRNIYFKVIDSKGTVFISSNSLTNRLASPKIYDTSINCYGYRSGTVETGGTIRSETDCVIYSIVDTTAPNIPEVYFRIDALSDATAWQNSIPTTSDLKGWTKIDSISSKVFGGPSSNLYLLVKATDANGIEKVEYTLNSDSSLATNVRTDVTGTESNLPYLYSFVKFDTSTSSLNGTMPLSIKATDNAGGTKTSNTNIKFDNEAPTVEFTSHSNEANVYGSLSVNVRGTTVESNGIESVKFCVTNSDSEPADNKYVEIKDYTSRSAWSILFNSIVQADTGDYYTETLNTYLDILYGSGTSAAEDVKQLYIWIKAADSLGNESVPKNLLLKVSPQGDKPSVGVTYPSSGETVGGTIRITGSTTIATQSVSSVWIQIDPTYDGSTFNEDWVTELNTLIDSKAVGYTIITATDDATAIANGLPVDSSGKAFFLSGIKVSGTQSWNIPINTVSEFNELVNNENRKMAIRVYAYSSTKKISEPKILSFSVDPKSPIIGGTNPLVLVQYENGASSGTIARKMTYENDMWISGIWYLTGSLEDDSGIKTVNWDDSPIYSSYITSYETKGSYSNYNMNIPIGNDTEGSFGAESHKLKIFEGSSDNKDSETTIKINYDNKKPGFSATSLTATDNEIVQSNGTYSISGTFNEPSSGSANQSGFKRIAMFFTRVNGSVTSVMDPMLAQTNSANRIDVTSITPDSNGIYWLSSSGTVTNNEITGVTITDNVRVGGLCKVNDVIYLIKTVGTNTVSLTTTPAFQGDTTVYFALAQVIDNTIAETGTTGTYNDGSSIINDDGDQMVESAKTIGTTTDWNVSIYSKNIADGPITIHFVAFDAAGNATPITYTGSVCNNQPRIVGLIYGTDDNGNGSVDNAELIKTYSGLYNWGLKNSSDSDKVYNGFDSTTATAKRITNLSIPSASLDSSAITIKGKTIVKPEIVGGNIGLGYTYSVAANKDADVYISPDATPVDLNSGDNDTDDVRTDVSDIELSVQQLLKKNIVDGNKQIFTFNIWDKTEGTTWGSTSQKAQIKICANVALKDNVKPTASFKKFYWNSKDDNSVYKDGEGNLQGHIELEDDLTFTGSVFTSSGTGVFDLDPKISGKVVFEGKANDNVLLDKLSIKISNFNSGSWFVIANRISGVWKALGNLETDGWTCELGDETFSQTGGNTVPFKFIFDSSKITGIAAADISFTVKATDRGAVSLKTGTDELTYNPNADSTEKVSDVDYPLVSYKTDVVPYITGITTWVSGNAGDEFARSALGYYDVYEGESIVIKGFNLKSGTTNPTVSINSNTGNNFAQVTSSTVNSVTTKIGTSATSGELKLIVNSIDSINNIDSSPTFTEGETTPDSTSPSLYNSWANTTNNKRLTDDIKLYVWKMGSFVSKTNITGPMMKMDSSGNSYMIYDNNTYNGAFSLVYDTNGTTYRIDGGYNKWIHSALAVDGQGRMFGVSTNSDRIEDSSAKFKFYTNRTTNGSWNTGSYIYVDEYRRSLEAVYNTSTSFYDIDRVSRPKMFASGTSGASKIFLSYYDQNHTQSPVKFRYGTANGTNVTGGIAGNINGTAQSGSNITTATGSAANFHVVADSTMEYQGGAYTAVGATSTGVAVVAWYDASRKSLVYSYNENPESPSYGGIWQTNAKIIDSNYAGWYVDMYVDSDNGIHIAYYNTGKGDLKYAYLPKYDCTSSEIQIVTIDSYLSAGTNITIQTRDETMSGTTYIVPYISYYHASFAQSPSSIRVAWMPKVIVKGSIPTISVGVKNDMFTQAWEVAVIPTTNIPVEAQVCLGLPSTGNSTYGNSPVIGFKSDSLGYEKAYIKY